MGSRRTGRRRAGKMIEMDSTCPTARPSSSRRRSASRRRAKGGLEQVGRYARRPRSPRPARRCRGRRRCCGCGCATGSTRRCWRRGPGSGPLAMPTTGLDHLDLEAAERRGVRVLALRGEIDFLREIRATAELTIALMLSLLRHVPEAAEHVRDGGWTATASAGASCTTRLPESSAWAAGNDRRQLPPRVRSDGARRGPASRPRRGAGRGSSSSSSTSSSVAPTSSRCTSVCPTPPGSCPGRPSWGGCGGRVARQHRAGRAGRRSGAARRPALRPAWRGAALDVLRDERPAGMADHPRSCATRASTATCSSPCTSGGATSESMAKTERFLADRLAAILEGEA